ncbi:B12-binding domain-containing radical SAM protein [Amaricoccus solimangrovi]|uniref:Radical SAM protein n=1 Tax=Amaricoccus solimangrovi TaxID=2589815 RepID=A0A501WBJ9_9RHOB|nr:radical SAM protein [Amaricoccus solimangrovi]TPE45760.1 radical SAM protein [Amaricoccus solimangrovi]
MIDITAEAARRERRRPRSAMRYERKSDMAAAAIRPLNSARRRTLIVDLNNFSVFPTLAIGLLVATLRNSGFEARVLCPLAYGVVAATRERRETILDHAARRLHHATWTPLRATRDAARDLRQWWKGRADPRVLRETARALDDRPDVVLLSAYLQHYNTVIEICRMAQARGIPVVLGGPYFNVAGTAEAWRNIPGLTAIVGGESDLTVARVVEAVCDGGDLLAFDGVLLPDGRRSRPAAPLRGLERIPIPDFTDFPWHLYKFRVVPVMTGRGCQWNRCAFCSDIVSASGRTFRTRPIAAVLNELREQSLRHNTKNFLFIDLKLNSNPAMFRGIIEEIQRYVQGAEWVGTVHVDHRPDNGLSRPELRAAVAAGMRRISFGLESGSQRLLDAMDKGCQVEENSRFLRHAHEAGLSVRATMFKGYPGETVEDLELTEKFLREHAPYLDRVRYNDFSIHEDTPIYTRVAENAEAYPRLRVRSYDHRNGRALYWNEAITDRAYRKVNARILDIVHSINRRPVRRAAQAFDGLM